MPRSPQDVTSAELAVLRVLWTRGEATIRDVTDELYPGGSTPEYSTVQKLLDRLQTKSFVTKRRDGRAHVFRATVARDELIERRLRSVADTLCDGSLMPLLTQLVGKADLDGSQLNTLRDLIERLDADKREDGA